MSLHSGPEWRICEWHIDKFPSFLLLFFFKMADEFKVCEVERRRDPSPLRATRKCNLLVSVCCLLVFIVNAYF